MNRYGGREEEERRNKMGGHIDERRDATQFVKFSNYFEFYH
jgi:hypothetical protein